MNYKCPICNTQLTKRYRMSFLKEEEDYECPNNLCSVIILFDKINKKERKYTDYNLIYKGQTILIAPTIEKLITTYNKLKVLL